MANIISRPDWYIPESEVTPESAYRDRRHFLRQAGFLGAATLLHQAIEAKADAPDPFPAKRNGLFNPGWRLTNEDDAVSYNNFHEFTTDKRRVKTLTGAFKTSPWEVKIGGLCEKPTTFDVDKLSRQIGLEERVYRFRCVEAWAMTVPWTGFPLAKLLRLVKPKGEARFVKFVTAMKPAEMPNVENLLRRGYPLPYTEGLRIDEAMNDLTMVATGIYGKPLPAQNGGPIRTVVPWKYGYKSIKSIVSIELVREQPATLWETLSPEEYPFESNVEPDVPHPRWSQATHRIIDTGERVRTLPYNGYEKQVAKLYRK